MQTSVMLSAPPILWLSMAIQGGFKMFMCISHISWDGGSFPCFGRVRVFCNEENSIGSSVLNFVVED